MTTVSTQARFDGCKLSVEIQWRTKCCGAVDLVRFYAAGPVGRLTKEQAELLYQELWYEVDQKIERESAGRTILTAIDAMVESKFLPGGGREGIWGHEGKIEDKVSMANWLTYCGWELSAVGRNGNSNRGLGLWTYVRHAYKDLDKGEKGGHVSMERVKKPSYPKTEQDRPAEDVEAVLARFRELAQGV